MVLVGRCCSSRKYEIMSFRQTLVGFPVRKNTSTKRKTKVVNQECNKSKEGKVSIPFVTKPNSVKRKLVLDINNTIDLQNSETSENGFGLSHKRRLFDENQLSPSKTSIMSLYQKAKQALHSSLPERLLGRDQERLKITEFIRFHLKNKQSGSLYISGAPGTGKTALLVQLLGEMTTDQFKYVYVNCMSLKQSISVYRKIATELDLKNIDACKRTVDKSLEKIVVTAKKMIVLVLDEIDQLDSKNQEVLYTLFEWPHLPNSKIILIGIANALDLTDRVLPRLHAYGCKPELLHFQPYTHQQILCILEDRMKAAEEGGVKIIQLSALLLCARKIAATSGDVRKALDVCRRAIEMAEAENKQQNVLKVSSDDGCNPGSPKKRLGSTIPLQDEERSIPLQQKLILCTALLIFKTIKSKEVSIAMLQSTYSEICKRRTISALSQMEFFNICSLLESQGLINVKKQKDARSSRMSLKVDEKELESVLQDRTLMASVLNECNVVKKCGIY